VKTGRTRPVIGRKGRMGGRKVLVGEETGARGEKQPGEHGVISASSGQHGQVKKLMLGMDCKLWKGKAMNL